MNKATQISTILLGVLTAMPISGCGMDGEEFNDAEQHASVAQALSNSPVSSSTAGSAFSSAKALDFVCDTPTLAVGVFNKGTASSPQMFYWKRDGISAPKFINGAPDSGPDPGAGSVYWTFEESSGKEWTLRRVNFLDKPSGWLTYQTDYSTANPSSMENCRQHDFTVLQCITKKRSVYVTKKNGKLAYIAYSLGALSPSFSLTNGVYTKSTSATVLASVAFTNGTYKYVVKFSPYNGAAFKGQVVITNDGVQIGVENCDMLTLGLGSPGVGEGI